MNAFGPAVAAIPGPPVVTFAVDLAAALAPVGIAIDVLAVLGAIVLLVARDGRRATSGCRRPRLETTTGEERLPPPVEAAIGLTVPSA